MFGGWGEKKRKYPKKTTENRQGLAGRKAIGQILPVGCVYFAGTKAFCFAFIEPSIKKIAGMDANMVKEGIGKRAIAHLEIFPKDFFKMTGFPLGIFQIAMSNFGIFQSKIAKVRLL